MATFYNQATLSYNGTVTNSNITTGELLEVTSLVKTSIGDEYSPGGTVSYAVSYTNVGGTAISGITVTDDLGGFTEGGNTVYPLEYIEGSVKYFVNGVLTDAPEVSAGPPLVISGISVPAGGNVLILYAVRTNEFTPRASGSTVTNTVAAVGEGIENASDSTTVTVRDEKHLTISKSICPESVTGGNTVNYTFVIQNSGNTPAVATDNLVVSDLFDPILTDITVTLDGNTLVSGTDYTYDEGTGNFATKESVITVPAATYVTDPETGAISTTPGVAVLKISGTL